METVLKAVFGLSTIFMICGFTAWGFAIYYGGRSSNYRKMERANSFVEPCFNAGIITMFLAMFLTIFIPG